MKRKGLQKLLDHVAMTRKDLQDLLDHVAARIIRDKELEQDCQQDPDHEAALRELICVLGDYIERFEDKEEDEG